MRAYLRLPLLAFVFFVVAGVHAQAATLIMVDWRACPHCWRFHQEVEGEYSASKAGQLAPLRKVNVLKKWPSDLKEIRPVRAAPVFILVNDGREIGRFSGYSSRKLFWNNLNELISKL